MMRRALVYAIVAAMCTASLSPAHADPVPNDRYYSYQWGLRKIHASYAWQKTRGRGAVVAVIDTGVDASHPDLKGRVLPGKDFADGSSSTADDNGHGTLIAGIIAADTSNRVGVASVAPEAKILPVRVLGADGTGSSQAVADGINWASDQGADVINLSLAQQSDSNGGGIIVSDALLRDQRVDQAIRAAAARGSVVVIASGNNSSGGQPQTAYDSTTPGVLVVGATTSGDARAAYSNYGSGLDLVAPGGGSAKDPADAACTRDNAVVSLWWNPKTKSSDYGAGCGTSMAVGFVSGVAALLASEGMSNARIAQRLISTADDIGPKGADPQTGAGRVDAACALGVSIHPAAAPSRTIAATTTAPRVGAAGGSPSPFEHSQRAVPRGPARAQAAAPHLPLTTNDRTTPVALALALLLGAIVAHGAWLARARRT